MIFVRTSWCKYCKMQENTTFRDPELVDLLNENFFCLKLDAESTGQIDFLGRAYAYDVSGGYQELAQMLGKRDGQLIFPTTVLLSRELNLVSRLSGLQKAKDIVRLIAQ